MPFARRTAIDSIAELVLTSFSGRRAIAYGIELGPVAALIFVGGKLVAGRIFQSG